MQLALLIGAVVCSSAQCISASRSPHIERFASFGDIQGQGSVGSELRLEETGSRVVATLTQYVGAGKPTKTQLTGTLTEGCEVHLSGKNKAAQIEIDGQIELTRFLGKVKRRLGKVVDSHILDLRRQIPAGGPTVGSVKEPTVQDYV